MTDVRGGFAGNCDAGGVHLILGRRLGSGESHSRPQGLEHSPAPCPEARNILTFRPQAVDSHSEVG